MDLATPPAEYKIDVELVAGLLRDQHPDLAELPIEPLESGWDNAMFRLGDARSVRLPRRAVAAQLLRNEQKADLLPALAALVRAYPGLSEAER